MTCKTFSPLVQLVDKVYRTGLALSHHALALLQPRFQPLPTLGKWFVRIVPLPALCCGWFISLEQPYRVHRLRPLARKQRKRQSPLLRAP